MNSRATESSSIRVLSASGEPVEFTIPSVEIILSIETGHHHLMLRGATNGSLGGIFLGVNAEEARANLQRYLDASDKSTFVITSKVGVDATHEVAIGIGAFSVPIMTKLITEALANFRPIRAYAIAIYDETETELQVFGVGNYEGNQPCQFLDGRKNPLIKLDTGEEVWGCQCWWAASETPEADIVKIAKGRRVVYTTVAEEMAKAERRLAEKKAAAEKAIEKNTPAATGESCEMCETPHDKPVEVPALVSTEA